MTVNVMSMNILSNKWVSLGQREVKVGTKSRGLNAAV